ncbi:MAG: chromosome segregation protein SMC [Fibrobacterota bacterium]|nr:MAG: chromosome segregation protein SMC [Fibrobacterota bacterium]
MYLSKLRVFGFKSFANKTEVNFPGDGITSVVGPNGCGKSNIIDAIRWVLGEQRAKALRGAKMEDVIFAGTSERPPLNMAEVTLIVKNDKGVLPSEFSEIMISRRAYRDGASEYLINNQPCRLRDIQNLFYDTGLGAASYSVIEQGQVMTLVQEKPEERRILFEEAAGISRYRAQRKEAIRQFEKTDQDLARVAENLAAVRRSVASFERQAKQVDTWKRLNSRLREVELSWIRLRRAQLKDLVGQSEHRIRDWKDECDTLRSEMSVAEAGAAEQRLEAARLESDLREREREFGDARAELQALEGERLRARDGLLHLSQNRERLADELQRLADLEVRIREELAVARRGIEESNDQGQEALQAMERAQEERRLREERLVTFREGAAEQAQARLSLLEDLNRAQADLLRAENELSRLSTEEERIREELDLGESAAEEMGAKLTTLRQTRESASARAEGLDHEKERVTEEGQLAGRRADQAQERERQAAARRASARSRLETLEKLAKSMEGVSDGAKAILSHKDRPSEIRGLFADQLRASPDVLERIEEVLGDALQYVVSDRTDSARQALARLSENSGGVAVLLPVDTLAHRATSPAVSGPGIRGWADQFVECDASFRPAAQLLLGNICLVDDEETALRLAAQFRGQDLWFASPGFRSHGSGLVAGGRKSGKSMGLLSRHQAQEDSRAELAEAETELESAQADREEWTARRAELQDRWREIDRQLTSARRELSEVETSLGRLEAQASGASDRLETLRQRLEILEPQSRPLRDRADQARMRVETLAEEKTVREGAARRAEEARAEAEADLKESQEAIREAERTVARLSGEVKRLETLAENAERHLDETDDRRHRARVESETLDSQEVERRGILEGLEAQADRAREELTQVQRARDQAREIYDAAIMAVEEKLSGVKGHTKRIDELSQAIHQADLARAEGAGEDNRLRQRAFETWEIDLDAEEDPPEPPEGFDRETAPKEIEELRGKLKNLGPLNPQALEEYEQEKARLDEVQKQCDDLEKAKNSLERAIKRLDKMARERFVDTFEKVRVNFQSVFSTLFGGGEGKLELEQDADPLEARIDIHARPTGKKMQAISLLSGGERALTATALLFALYLIRPSPYCIMDEVDAPLDDANIGRFVELLRKFSHQTQFIVVTHNKRTMAASDMLYGVTQEIKGISQLASVQLDEAVKLAD